MVHHFITNGILHLALKTSHAIAIYLSTRKLAFLESKDVKFEILVYDNFGDIIKLNYTKENRTFQCLHKTKNVSQKSFHFTNIIELPVVMYYLNLNRLSENMKLCMVTAKCAHKLSII